MVNTELLRGVFGEPGKDWIPYWVLEVLDKLCEKYLTDELYRCQN